MSNRWKGGFIQAYFDPLTVGPNVSPLYTVGLNNNGQLGDGVDIDRSSPVQIGTLTTWTNISASRYTSGAVKQDGTLWTWGDNGFGMLGLNTNIKVSSPVQVGALNNWSDVAMGQVNSYGIKTDGSMWALGGYGSFGGNGTTSVVYAQSSPIQIGTLTTWYKVKGGDSGALALKTDGTLWGWGYNAVGQIGSNNRVDYSSPVQIGALSNWADITYVAYQAGAIKTDGTLWTWGSNDGGQLGLGDFVNRSSPVQVGALTNWNKVSSGRGHMIALKTDGTIWSWGAETSGQIGQNTSSGYYSSPVQIGVLTDWNDVMAGGYFSLAVKNNGSLWSLGANNYGQLGLNSSINKSSPTQVGSNLTWNGLAGGYYHAILTEDL